VVFVLKLGEEEIAVEADTPDEARFIAFEHSDRLYRDEWLFADYRIIRKAVVFTRQNGNITLEGDNDVC
jgi:hypothetical protein